MSQCSLPSKIKYIYDLPLNPRKYLCDILDADKRWEDLVGLMRYNVTTLMLIGQSIYRDKSPTWELLNKFSEKNGTIDHLFVMLAKMDHQRAMLVLEPYVSEQYLFLLRKKDTTSTVAFTCSKKEDIPKPSLLQQSKQSTPSSSGISSSSYQNNPSGATGYSPKVKPTASSNLANFNQQFSSVSLHSNKKVLNVTQDEPNCVKKLPNMNCSKRNISPLKEESISSNIVTEKLKNVKKQSPEDVTKAMKSQKSPSHFPYAENLLSQEDSLPDIMRISYEDICKITDNFNEERVLGEGGFGKVYKGKWMGTSVAIKCLKSQQNSQDSSQQLISLKQSLNELNLLKCLRLDHILPLFAVSLDGEDPCLIYQLMVNGSLEDRLLLKNKTPALTWYQRSHIAKGITKGLHFLHTACGKPFVHGDIKSANILLDGNMDAKIGDFGLTREGPGCEATHVMVSSVCGTECYLPLEYKRHRHLSPQVDIYSYGIVLLEIATGLRPLDPKRGEGSYLVDHVAICSDSGHLESLRDTKAGEENRIWFRELIQIGQKCSSKDKKKRPLMQEVLKQFKKIKEERFTKDKVRPASITPCLCLPYDHQKDGEQQIEVCNKLSCSQGGSKKQNLLTSDILDPAKETTTSSKLNQSSSFIGDATYDSLDCILRETNFASNHLQTSQNSSEDRSNSNNPALVPLVTVLQWKVS